MSTTSPRRRGATKGWLKVAFVILSVVICGGLPLVGFYLLWSWSMVQIGVIAYAGLIKVALTLFLISTGGVVTVALAMVGAAIGGAAAIAILED